MAARLQRGRLVGPDTLHDEPTLDAFVAFGALIVLGASERPQKLCRQPIVAPNFRAALGGNWRLTIVGQWEPLEMQELA
jgi:hypothetical protein